MENAPSILQPHVINVTDWVPDEIYPTYPEGARSKLALFPPPGLGLPFIKQGRRYLYKRSDKRYPSQFWGEIVAYLVGGLLDVPVPPAFAAFHDKEGDCGALIEWFYEDGKAQFFAGGHYMQALMPEYDRKKGKEHNFHSIRALSRKYAELGFLPQDWRKWWCEAFLFDALIGNTDRHQDNWGFLSRRRRDQTVELSLAPLFDNGTSLGHELETARFGGWHNDQLTAYVARGRHHIKWMKGDERGIGHLDILLRLRVLFPVHINDALSKLESFDIVALDQQLDDLSRVPVSVPLTLDRKNLYIKLISVRQKRILEAML